MSEERIHVDLYMACGNCSNELLGVGISDKDEFVALCHNCGWAMQLNDMAMKKARAEGCSCEGCTNGRKHVDN